MEEIIENAENIVLGSDTYQCSCCGAALKYKPGTTLLHCEYCGSDTPIDAKVADTIQELDFEQYARQFEKLNIQTTKVISCHKCGAESSFDESLKSIGCPYCNSPLIESDIHEERLIKPSYLLPFKVTDREMQVHVNKWLSKLWFAPNKLKTRSTYSNKLQGVYIPCWTYDAQTNTNYSGERGDHYTVTVGSGKNRRTETRTRWSFRTGHISLFFDDIMVPASKIINSEIMSKISNWDTKNMVESNNQFLSGFITEKYVINMNKGYEVARKIMGSRIQDAVKRDIGGDRQRIHSVNTKISNIKFKLILLPVYMSSYTYHNKLYHFFVNGRTGRVTGDRPYSTAKITLTILFVIFILVGVWLFFTGN